MKKVLIVILAAAGVLCTKAETVSQKQALQMAAQFFNEATGRVVAPPKMVYNGRKLTTNRLFNPFYVYNSPLGGFVIISAENKAFPILGFSLKDNFDASKIGDTETALLTSYAREIELIRYEGEPVEQTERAWQNYPEYVSSILNGRYEATDPLFSIKEAAEMISTAERNDDAVYSDLYTPEQWNGIMIEELSLKKSVPLLIYSGFKEWPAVIYGHQGDYFRIEMSERNSWLMRLNATESISSLMVSVNSNRILEPETEEEVKPFVVLDEILDDTYAQENSRRAASSIDKVEIEGQPTLRVLGSGHYEVVLPEDARIAMVYNLGGNMVSRQTFMGTPVINIDLTADPPGFYFLMILGDSGTPYGLKLYR